MIDSDPGPYLPLVLYVTIYCVFVGTMIGIGESYFFRYNEGPSSSATSQHPPPKPFLHQAGNNPNQIYFDESPYAVVNNRGEMFKTRDKNLFVSSRVHNRL